ncbi:hypothetical protein FC678_25660, partial [Peribacillus simplex]
MSIAGKVIDELMKEWHYDASDLLQRIEKGETIRSKDVWNQYVKFQKKTDNVAYFSFALNSKIPINSVWPLYERVYCSIPYLNDNYEKIKDEIM